MPDSTADTRAHIELVQTRIKEITFKLLHRASVHDASKLKRPEKAGFDKLSTRLAALEYGSDEYRAALEEGRPTIEHHYAHNSHHPEHWPNGINDMSLLDIIEMMADWKAASERVKQGSIKQGLEVNKKRFGISDQLMRIFENTCKELDW
jgi:hypothetical protein